MKYFYMLQAAIVLTLTVNSQTESTQWMFVKGDVELPAVAHHGTKGVSSIYNTPGGRRLGVSWEDTSGNLWGFGGNGADNTGRSGYFSDLWKFTVSTNQWTWVKGDSTTGGVAVYGRQGEAFITNNPGGRFSGFSWMDSLDNLWLFGGTGTIGASDELQFYNELWKYSPSTNLWTWMKGDSITNGLGNRIGNFGTLEVAAESNTPGNLSAAVSWKDNSENLWILGGYGSGRIAPGEEGAGAIGSGPLNQVWKYDRLTNLWTWMKGDSTTPGRGNTRGVYGIRGIPAKENTPPPGPAGAWWIDSGGNLWIFGQGNRNDLWKFSPANNLWTWLNGDSSIGNPGSYGIKGLPADRNTPSSRTGSASWTDASGNMWLFGGETFNDLWKYNPSTNQWTWIEGDSTRNALASYGTKGVGAATNTPGGRNPGQYWKDDNSNLWLFGNKQGVGLNDLWKYDPQNNEWTWIAGDSINNGSGSYGTKGSGSTTNTPKARDYHTTWKAASGKIWFFGGSRGLHFLNDLWNYNPVSNLWTWVSGDSIGVIPAIYGTKGVAAAANKPLPRYGAISWVDTSSNLWVFGGQGNKEPKAGLLNDLWKFERSQWIWVSGDSLPDASPYFVAYGIPDPRNKAGARTSSVSWKDLSGNLWLYGGAGWSSNQRFGYLNDLWKYDAITNNWTCYSGGNFHIAPVYGTKGIGAPTNQPGGRFGSVSFTDASGNFWLFGGLNSTQNGGPTGYGNDLWKYSPSSNIWTWIEGNDVANIPGIYGLQSIPDAANNPGGRYNSIRWTDTSGNFWLFGGIGYDVNGIIGPLNDLWKYTVSTGEWTWMNGDNTANSIGNYGSLQTTAETNRPGARYAGVGWLGTMNNLWMFGGIGFSASGNGYLNDLWKYNTLNNQWTWVKGDSTINVAGTMEMGANAAKPGSRGNSVSWVDSSGRFWLFGGEGFFLNAKGILNDLWSISSLNPLPLKLISFSGKIINEDVSLLWQTSNEINTNYYNVQRSLDGVKFETIGKVTAAVSNSSINDNLFTDKNTGHLNSVTVFYRIQIVNKDNSKTYSSIIRLDLSNAKPSITITPNPASTFISISISNTKNEIATLIISDIKGAIVRKELFGLINGTTSKVINLISVKSGTYTATIIGSALKKHKKFLKQ